MMMMMMMMMMNQISSSTTTTVPKGEPNLIEDLIFEIFKYLHPKSLLRFKSLSKTLHSLISNPDFLRRNTVHQFRHQDPSLLPPPPIPHILFKQGQELSADSKVLLISPSPHLHGDGDSKILMISPSPHLHGDGDGDGDGGYYYSKLLQNLIDYGPEHDHQPPDGNYEKVKFNVIDSCNGLLLYLNCVRHQNDPPGKKCISWYVCNPITKDYIKLPPLDEQEQGFKIIHYPMANLVFDPSLSLTYKVVIWLAEYGAWRLYVYSSDTRSWRLSVKTTINDFLFGVLQEQSNDFEFRAVLLNGVLYWSTLMPMDMDVSICYDVEKDSVWTLKFPKMPLEYVGRQLFYFGVCGGGLRLIEKYCKQYCYDKHAFPSSFDVMEMNQLQLQQKHQDHQDGNIDDDRDLWTVKYRVNIGEEGYFANLIKGKSRIDVLILDLYKTTTKAGGEGEEEVLLCINDHCRLIISFNLSDNTFGRELLLTDHIFNFKGVLRFNISLFPLIH